MSLVSRLAVLAGVVALAATAVADWPQFMGPSGTGLAPASEKVNKDWAKNPPKELWKAEMGPGFTGAAIANKKVYITDRVKETESFRVFDLETGKEEWSGKYEVPPFNKRDSYPGTRGTPAIDGDVAYTISATGPIMAWDLKGQKPLWKKDLLALGAKNNAWDFAMSPVVVGDLLIVDTPGSATTGVIALDKKTGETKWSSPAFGVTETYTTPQWVKIGGVDQLLCWHKGVVAGLDPKDGKMLWKYAWKTDRPIPNPLLLPGDKIFLTIGYGGGCSLIQIEGKPGAFTVKEIFQGETWSGSKCAPAIFSDGYIYTSGNDQGKGIQCLDLDGKVKWSGPDKYGLGSLIVADGVIIAINGNKGDLVLIEASPKEYKELGSIKALGGSSIWAPLALSDGRLVIRDQSTLKCYDVGVK